MQKEYLAYIEMMGGGTWCRSDNVSDAITRAVKGSVEDWGSMFKMDGEEVPVNLYDITGMDKLVMGSDGVFCIDKEQHEECELLEVLWVQLPEKGKRKITGSAYKKQISEACKLAYSR